MNTNPYHDARRQVRDALKHIGRAVTRGEAERGMTPAQVSRIRAVNPLTDEVWQYRALADGALIAEVSYSWFMQAPLFGLTIFCVGDLAGDAESWDHSLSGAFRDVGELAARLAELNTGGHERIAALAAQAGS